MCVKNTRFMAHEDLAISLSLSLVLPSIQHRYRLTSVFSNLGEGDLGYVEMLVGHIAPSDLRCWAIVGGSDNDRSSRMKAHAILAMAASCCFVVTHYLETATAPSSFIEQCPTDRCCICSIAIVVQCSKPTSSSCLVAGTDFLHRRGREKHRFVHRFARASQTFQSWKKDTAHCLLTSL
jgi:hypothetical protein